MEADTVFRSQRVVVGGAIRAADVVVEGGLVRAVERHGSASARRVLDLGDDALLPGLVDSHVHLNEPGRAEWEGFESGTRAAAAGGITTLVDMPLNSIPATTSVAALDAKRRAAAGKLSVDVGFWGGVVPGNAAEIEPLATAGVLGFKAFLVDSGVEEFPCVSLDDLRRAAPALAATGKPLLVHAEWPQELCRPDSGADPASYSNYLATRPQECEVRAIEALVTLAETCDLRLHIVHLASEAALPVIIAARARGVRLTVETCPHYLTFAAEEVPDGACEFKCAPPIRGGATREALWGALEEGVIDAVVTDHSPAPPGLKEGDFLSAWGGIASLQVSLPAVWTEASRRGLGLERVVRWMAEAPAALAGIAHKGRIAVGLEADLVAFRSDEEVAVDALRLYHRHATTPYDGRRLKGRVVATYLRGEPVAFDRPRGRMISR